MRTTKHKLFAAGLVALMMLAGGFWCLLMPQRRLASAPSRGSLPMPRAACCLA